MRHYLFGILSVIIFNISAFPGHTATEGSKAVGLVTGPKTGTYYAFGKDIADILQASGQSVMVKPTSGSIENIKRMVQSGENAGLGIVQSDVLSFLKRSDNPNSKRVASKLRLVFPFYKEEIHVLADKGVASFSDLQDKRVIIGPEGSGSALTAINLFSISDVAPAEMRQMTPAEGVVAVLAGDADAMIFVGGKPVPLFDNLSDLKHAREGRNAHLLDEVHFLPITNDAILKEYEKSTIQPNDYEFVEKEIPTVAVSAVLVSYDFSTAKNQYYVNRCNQLEDIGRALRKQISFLKDSGHPKWQEVDLSRSIDLWEKDECSWRTAGDAAPRFNSELERDLLSIIRDGKGKEENQ
jgi:TRAP transporter TAXI family solute receptor